MAFPISRIIAVNVLMIGYLLSPNLTSFLGVALLISIALKDHPFAFAADMVDCVSASKDRSFSAIVNDKFNDFLRLTVLERKI